MRTKRILFCVLAVALMFCMLSISAFADETSQSESLAEMIASAQENGGYVLVDRPVSDVSTVTIPAGVTVDVKEGAEINTRITVSGGTLNVSGGSINNESGYAVYSSKSASTICITG